MIRRISIDLLSGIGISIFISFIPYLGISDKGIGMTVFAVNADADPLQSFWALACCCGVFVLGPLLKHFKSRLTTIIPSILVLSSAIYVHISNLALHTISTVILWISTIALIPIGAVPALISSVIPGITRIGALFISSIFGIGLCFLFEYLPFDFTGFCDFHFPHRGSHSDSHYSGSSPIFGSTSYFVDSSFSGSGSYSASDSNSEIGSDSFSDSQEQSDDQEDNSKILNYPSFHNMRGNSFSESKKNAWGNTEYFDEYGHRIGESREDAWGHIQHYDEHGNHIGESREDAWGHMQHYDEHGNRTGQSE